MDVKAGTQTTEADPWDAALFGGAEASMYKTAPVVAPAKPIEVTSVFKESAGIPRDIIPPPQSTAPVISPLSPFSILAEVPRAPVKVTPLKPLTPPPAPPAPKETLLAPAYPVASLTMSLLLLIIGIPLFTAGFYLADYTKNRIEQPAVANIETAVQQSVMATTTVSH